MKIFRIILVFCLGLAAFGCHQRPIDTVPAGSFRLIVEDLVKDATCRVTSLKVSSSQPGMLSVSKEESRYACQLLIPAGQKLREGQMFFIASKATDSRTTNAYVLANLQLKSQGGDGDKIAQAAAQADLGSWTFYPPRDTGLEAICNLTAKSGVYPLNVPVEIGRIDGKPMILTVGKQTL